MVRYKPRILSNLAKLNFIEGSPRQLKRALINSHEIFFFPLILSRLTKLKAKTGVSKDNIIPCRENRAYQWLKLTKERFYLFIYLVCKENKLIFLKERYILRHACLRLQLRQAAQDERKGGFFTR